MKPLYSEHEFKHAKSNDKLLCKCYQCSKPFYKIKHEIVKFLNGTNVTGTIQFCSNKCRFKSRKNQITLNCTNCNKTFDKHPNQIKKSKSGNHFCSSSCSASYNNKNKKHGTRRSKLEKWLEEQLTLLYPNLNIHFNRKDTIDSELDIYFPSLNLAIELNGIFHYEPIYGKDKLNQIQENDISKSKACHDLKIDLCTIDTSSQKYFKPKSSQKYLDIIINIVNERMLTS